MYIKNTLYEVDHSFVLLFSLPVYTAAETNQHNCVGLVVRKSHAMFKFFTDNIVCFSSSLPASLCSSGAQSVCGEPVLHHSSCLQSGQTGHQNQDLLHHQHSDGAERLGQGHYSQTFQEQQEDP